MTNNNYCAPAKLGGSQGARALGRPRLICGCILFAAVCIVRLVLTAAEMDLDSTAPLSKASPAATTASRIRMSQTEVGQQGNRERPAAFYPSLEAALKRRGKSLSEVCDVKDAVARRVLEDYGAIFLAAETVLPPPVCVFESQPQVEQFQREAKFIRARIGADEIELQPAAMEALLSARAEARRAGLDITPRGGSEAARRSYTDTERLWDTRFLPALAHWQRLGRLSRERAAHLRALPLKEQVREVLELEKSGIYFSKDFSKSILYSIAAPGTSQHMAMLALDVEQFLNPRVRRILAAHGWFQTVKSDLPHFTYLGLAEKDLPSRGLRPVESGQQLFWIPNVE